MSAHYQIEYKYRGEPKSFFISSPAMNNAEAWHWATVDAGCGQIPKYRTDKTPKLSKPQAERLGVTEVTWSEA